MLAETIARCLLFSMAYHFARAAYTPTLFFNYTVSAASPMLHFLPSMQTKMVHADSTTRHFAPPWNTSFSGIPWATYTPGQAGVGTPRSWVYTVANSTMNLGVVYWGTGIFYSGAAEAAQASTPPMFISAKIENIHEYANPPPPGRSIPLDTVGSPKQFSMMGGGGMKFEKHLSTIGPSSLNRSASLTLSIDSVSIEAGIRTNATKFSEVNARVERIITAEGNWNEFFLRSDVTPGWEVSSELDGVAGQPTPPYAGQRTVVTTSVADRFNIFIPRGTAFVVVNGTTGPVKGMALIQVHAPAPETGIASEVTLTNPWISLETLFMAPLNPARQYNITISPIVGDSNKTYENYTYPNGVGLHSVTLYSAGDVPEDEATEADNGSQPSSKPQTKGGQSVNAGAIAGGVVAGVVVLLVAAAVLFFWKRKKSRNVNEKFHIDDSPLEYKDVDAGGYTDAALTGSVPTDPLLPYSSEPAAAAQHVPARQDLAPRRPRVLHAVDMEDAPLAGTSHDTATPPPADMVTASASTNPLVAMQQHQLDALLGVGTGTRTGKQANSIVRVPQSKIALLNRALAPPTHQSDTTVSIPQHELDSLLGISGSVPPSHGSDDVGTAVSMPQYKLDVLLADISAQRPPTYHH